MHMKIQWMTDFSYELPGRIANYKHLNDHFFIEFNKNQSKSQFQWGQSSEMKRLNLPLLSHWEQ